MWGDTRREFLTLPVSSLLRTVIDALNILRTPNQYLNIRISVTAALPLQLFLTQQFLLHTQVLYFTLISLYQTNPEELF